MPCKPHPACASHHVKVDAERSLHIREWTGRGEPLVLLHGLMSSSASWSNLAATTTRPCFALDLPGFGHSSQPSRARLVAYAEDVACALQRLDVNSFTLIGHSFGGAVATGVAERLPGAAKWLVLCAPAGFGRLPIAEVAALPLIRGFAVGMAPCVERRPSPPTRVRAANLRSIRLRHPAVASRLRPGLRTALEALADGSRSWGAYPGRPVAYDGPVAAVWGQRDGVIPTSHVSRLTWSLPQADVYLCPSTGHHVHREQPRDLARFLETGAAAGLRWAAVAGAMGVEQPGGRSSRTRHRV